LTKDSGCDRFAMEASIYRLKIAYSSASIPKAKTRQSPCQMRRDVRGLSTTAAFEAVVFERECEVMSRNRYVPKPDKNLRATDRGGYRGWLSLLNRRVNEELRVAH
jgi:hypothetical protein